MVKFKQKTFTEYDAMRSLYVELMKNARGNKDKYTIIDTNSLIPVLRSNSVVIERFVISTSFGHKDKYRMYLKVGAQAKMPDEVRLPGFTHSERIGNLGVEINGSTWSDPRIDGGNYNYMVGGYNTAYDKNDKQKGFSRLTPFSHGTRIKLFSDDKYHPDLRATFQPNYNLSYEVNELLGDAIKYDKKERSLVLEFKSIQDAVHALDILPFGINYKIYLLNL